VATDLTGEKKKLNIQGVRPFTNLWYELNRSRIATGSGTADELADIIWQAVEKKSKRTSLSQRSKLVLAIDANRLAGLTLDSVVHRMHNKYGTELSTLKFQSIWLVGPSPSRTQQLDV
jgi:hypothetical protein